ncbi:MAG: DUF4347 domain-containing protein, partial [Gammaproteobacteria bacterium]|nr:DUF4347 domain-containing protein [Gammaproteobacteria bacterium]
MGSAKKKQKTKKPSKPMIEALEPKLLFSADLFGAAIDGTGADDPVQALLDENSVIHSHTLSEIDDTVDHSGTVTPLILDESEYQTILGTGNRLRSELVFVDAATPDYQQLLDDLLSREDEYRQFEVVVLEADRDGVAQISDHLAGYRDLDAVHIISHGSDGAIRIGNSTLDQANLNSKSDEIESWSQAFNADGDLLIYGCDLASTEQGEQFVSSLSRLTGADVAASDDVTGHTAQGGDWDLEYHTGEIETTLAVDAAAQAEWDGILAADVLTSSWSGSGSGPFTSTTSAGDPVGISISFATPAGTSVSSSGTGTMTSSAFFSNASVQSHSSLDVTLTWDTTSEGGENRASDDAGTITVTVTFDTAVTDPILHIDRLGGSGGTLSNSTEWTVTTAGVTLTKLDGVGHLQVESDKFYRTPDVSTSGTEASSNSATGTAAGSIQINGTFTTLTFDVTGIGVEGAGADAVEMVWEASVPDNSAPVLSGANDLSAIDEDPVGDTGTLVSAMISGQVSDADSGAQSGIAVVAVDDTNGTWQYKTASGSWTAFGAVDASSARLLAADASVRFVPDADWNGTVTDGITFHAWDQTSGSDGGTADINNSTTETVRDEFGIDSFSGNDGTVNWVGAWQEIGESDGSGMGDVEADGTPQSLEFGESGFGSADLTGDGVKRQVDLSAATSATLTLDAWRSGSAFGSNVKLAVSADGTNWTDLETFSFSSTPTSSTPYSYDISAYASATTWIRLLGSGTVDDDFLYFDNVQVEYTTAGGGIGGGTTAFSSDSASSSITVNPDNNAPVLSGANDLSAIDEDPVGDTGTLVSAMISGQVSDADSGAQSGIAVVAVDDTNGTWQYKTASGSWTAFGAVDTSNARLLAADASVRFVPDADWNGTVTDGITFHAWDQTSGSDGGTADLVTTGGSSVIATEDWNPVSYSGGSGVWVGNWTETGDDGSASGGNIKIATVGQVVADDSSYLQMSLSSSAGIERGVDLSGLDSATLSFYYEENTQSFGGQIGVQAWNGSTWVPLHTIDIDIVNYSGVNGVFSGEIDIPDPGTISKIRFYVTDTAFNDVIYIDNVQISGSATTMDTGGNTAFSAASASSSITVNSVDDPAVITGNTSGSGNEGTVISGDLDATDFEGLTDTTYFTIKTQGANGTAAIDAETGAWTFTPSDAYWFDNHELTVTATDDEGDTTDQIVSITVNNVDDAANISGDTSGSGNEGTVISGDLDATDADGLSDTTYFTIKTQGANGSAAIDAETGAWSYTPSDAD